MGRFIRYLQTLGLPVGSVPPPAFTKPETTYWRKCGGGGDRTRVQTVSLTEYKRLCLAVLKGLEPSTSAVTGRHSNQLNYSTI